jgi:hypothetical protein
MIVQGKKLHLQVQISFLPWSFILFHSIKGS